MADITHDVDPASGITTYTIEGVLKVGELRAYLEANEDRGAAQTNLFDLRHAKWQIPSMEEFRSNVIAAYSQVPEGTRGAFVFSEASDFGLGRLLETYSDSYGIRVAAFLDLDEALQWLKNKE